MTYKVGDFVIYEGKTYRFPGEVVAITTDGQLVVKAIGDSDGNYTGMKHIFGPDQLKPWALDDKHGKPFLVIDPELDAIAQIRAYCGLHPEKDTLGAAQLHALVDWLNGVPTGIDSR